VPKIELNVARIESSGTHGTSFYVSPVRAIDATFSGIEDEINIWTNLWFFPSQTDSSGGGIAKPSYYKPTYPSMLVLL